MQSTSLRGRLPGNLATSPQTGCQLFALPAELQKHIYEYMLAVLGGRDRNLRLSSKNIHLAAPTRLALLSTCRRIRNEVLSFFYRLIDVSISSMDLGGFLQRTSRASLLAITHLTIDVIPMFSSGDWKTPCTRIANAELSELASLPALKVLRMNMCQGLFQSRSDRQSLQESIVRCPSLTTILLEPDIIIVSHDSKGKISRWTFQRRLQSQLDEKAEMPDSGKGCGRRIAA